MRKIISILAVVLACSIGFQMHAYTAEQIDTVTVFSKAMKKDIRSVVVVPTDYKKSVKTYPTLYLLHGFSGCYTDWSSKKDLGEVADQYGIIIVCPDGQDSWYWDSPLNPKMKFETYIAKELLPHIDANYRTIKEAKARCITGLSMGGHGAMWLAMRHTDLWSIVGSMSGGLDISQFKGRWSMQQFLGDPKTYPSRWHDYSAINLIPTVEPGALQIILDCGLDDFFYQVNLDFHNALIKAKLDHVYMCRPGKHTWDYWVNALDYQMVFFNKALHKNGVR